DYVREVMRDRRRQNTHVIVFQAPIGGMPVEIADDDIRDAIRPRHAGTSTFSRIDLNGLATAESSAYYAGAREAIAAEVARLHAPRSALRTTAHGSVFALAPIPLLIDFGASLTDKIAVDVFMKSQTQGEGWAWGSD